MLYQLEKIMQGVCQMTESPDSFAIDSCAWNAPIMCQEKGVSHQV
jgi:hypothetical protein